MAGAAVDTNLADDVQDQVLGAHVRRQLAPDLDRHALRASLQQALRGQHMAHLAGSDTEGQRTESAVRGGVAVTADDGHARLGQSLFGCGHVHDTACRAVEVEQLDAMSLAVSAQRVDLMLRLGAGELSLPRSIGR